MRARHWPAFVAAIGMLCGGIAAAQTEPDKIDKAGKPKRSPFEEEPGKVPPQDEAYQSTPKTPPGTLPKPAKGPGCGQDRHP